MSNEFYILSVDGGGFRGVFAAYLLKQMEQQWSINWHGRFGLFAGTSTGSILAAGLACGISAASLYDFYREHGPVIFRRRKRSYLDPLKIFISRYSNSNLQRLLENITQGQTLGDVPVPLILPAVDIGNGCVHVFKSQYDSRFVRDAKVRVSDAILASCSAQTYFDPHVVDGIYQLADGGLWANNPALIAAIDAHYRLGIALENIRVLSIGTGKCRAFYPRRTDSKTDWLTQRCLGWGLMTRWQRGKVLDLILNLQADTAHNMLCLLLGESPIDTKRVCRLTFESDQPLPMDAACKGDDWTSIAAKCFTDNANRIAGFLSVQGGGQ